MSAFTDKIDSFFSRFVETSHEDLVKVEQAVEEKVHPVVNDLRDELKADLATLEADVKRDYEALKAQVEALLKGQATPPAAS
ncbi:hypothetical protein ABZX95_17120 [Streptomyces sp. NPDC004232]|uniref:hypothetical protein n=1 Tax=Streptomyces sp. NPDC004232 TaxID=3154454 RepID=UPI0033B53FED